MPAVKMKSKTTSTCKKDDNYPHVSQKSNKISKVPCSMVRVINEKENLPISCQTSQNDFCKIEESFEDHDNKGDMKQTSLSLDGCTDLIGQTCPSFNGCTDSIAIRDSLPSSLSPGSEIMLPYFNWPNCAHCQISEAVNREQTTWTPQADDNFFTTFQMFDVLDIDSNAHEVLQTWFPTDGLTVFDEIQNYNNLSDIVLPGDNFLNCGTEGNMVFPTLEETIGAVDYHYGGFYEGLPQMSDCSWFNLLSHQAIPFAEEFHVNSSRLDSNRIEYLDQETFVKNVLELSDEVNSLPALVSQETSKRKNVTLVLDLDETLVHSCTGQCDGADFTFQMITDKEFTVYVRKRPFLHEFLEKVSDMFEIIVFTASKRVYAEKLLDVLDPHKKLFSRRVCRESCTWKDNRCVKDLTVLGIDLAKVFIIDNTPEVYRFQVNNGIPIKSWFDDPTDSALISLLPFLEKLVDVDDVRPLIEEKYGAGN